LGKGKEGQKSPKENESYHGCAEEQKGLPLTSKGVEDQGGGWGEGLRQSDVDAPTKDARTDSKGPG